MDRLSLGDVRIHRIEEWKGVFMSPQHLFTGFDQSDYDRIKDKVPATTLNTGNDEIYARLQSWVIEIGDLKILLDTGAGNDKERPGIPLFGHLDTPFMARLAAAGFQPGDIDMVICTHLHVDHVGWNTKLEGGAWAPTFPHARYIFSAADAEYWNPDNRAKFPEKIGEAVNEGFFNDSVRPILQRGMAELVSGSAEVAPGVTLDPAPGHTPGSMTIAVTGSKGRALFVGDIVHHPLQVFQPQWNSIFCEDQNQARITRRAVLARAADDDAVMIPAHFAEEHMVRVKRSGGDFELGELTV
jgi:glyoxylase-like metal-dependent hydrolase (beta-lactamase superfamily II)